MAEDDARSRAKRLAELESVAEIMTFAIAREKASAEYYERALAKATTDAARRAFSLLLEQERDHERRMREELGGVRREIERESPGRKVRKDDRD